MKKLLGFIIGMGLLIAAAPASAAVWNFTESVWQGVETSDPFSNAGLTLSSTKGGAMTWNNETPEDPGPQFGDGIGIGNDEISGIDGLEKLKVTFDTPTNISKIGFLDFFEFGTNSPNGGNPEKARWDTDSGVFGIVTANNDESSTGAPLEGAGIDFITPGLTGVNWIEFSIPSQPDLGGSTGDDTTHDYALYKIEGNPVPIPGAVWLLGTGLLGLLGFRKKRKG